MPTKPKTLSDWKGKHDRNTVVPAKINAALVAMFKEHPENWEYEGDFIKRAGISQTDIGAFRDQFSEHIVVAKGETKRTWFADKKVAKKARED